MAFIIPDELLENLICSTCNKYLSVKPIKIYRNEQIRCGRCSSQKDDGVISLYGNIVENALFPCINRYEGCNSYMPYSEVSAHEIKCKSGSYGCPLCPPDKFEPASAYYFFNHYKISHPDNILSTPEFLIDINEESENKFVYCKNNHIYIVYARVYVDDKSLTVNASNIVHKEQCTKVAQKVILRTLNKKLLIETKYQACSSLDNNLNAFRIPLSKLMNNESTFVICTFIFDTAISNFIVLPNNFSISSGVPDVEKGLHNVYRKIYLCPEFRELYPNFCLAPCKTKIVEVGNERKVEFPRICNFCENTFQNSGETSNLYTCTNGHFVCEPCYNYNLDCCEGPYVYAERESEIYNLLYFYCKYNCQRFYCGQDLRYHETRCRNNDELFLDKEQIGKKYFGSNYSSASNCLVRNTNVIAFDEIVFEKVAKVFVITTDNFNFILNCLQEKNNLRFWITHNYPIEKYYVLIRIKEQYLNIYSRVNSFTLDANNRNIRVLSVVLRKV